MYTLSSSFLISIVKIILNSFVFKGTPIKDVVIPSNAPKTLFLQKHADYIAAYGEKKDDYVRHGCSCFTILLTFSI